MHQTSNIIDFRRVIHLQEAITLNLFRTSKGNNVTDNVDPKWFEVALVTYNLVI